MIPAIEPIRCRSRGGGAAYGATPNSAGTGPVAGPDAERGVDR